MLDRFLPFLAHLYKTAGRAIAVTMAKFGSVLVNPCHAE